MVWAAAFSLLGASADPFAPEAPHQDPFAPGAPDMPNPHTTQSKGPSNATDRNATIAAFEVIGAEHAELFSPAFMEEQPSGRRRNGLRRPRENAAARHLRLFGDGNGSDFINAAMQGQTIGPVGTARKCHKRDHCHHRLPDGSPCWTNLWTDVEHYTHHLQGFEGTQEARSATVYEQLRHGYYAEEGAAGEAVGTAKWHFRAGRADRLVCRDVFLLAYPIGDSTLYSLQKRHVAGEPFAHNKTTGKHAETETFSSDFGACSVIGWYRGYASVVGDWMPDQQQQIVPRRERTEEYEEYMAAVGAEHVSYEYFCKMLRCTCKD